MALSRLPAVSASSVKSSNVVASSVSMAAHPADSQTGMGGGAPSFPSGLRLLVVDDDPTCLMIVAGMLRKCNYEGARQTPCLALWALTRMPAQHFELRATSYLTS